MTIAPKTNAPRTCPSCHAVLPLAGMKRCPVCKSRVDLAGSPGQGLVEAMLDVLADPVGDPRRKSRQSR
jgi:hypothetical protein